MTTTSAHAFELSEFRERSALEKYLVAMFGETVIGSKPGERAQVDRSRVAAEPQVAQVATVDIPIYFKDLVAAFGPLGTVPSRSQIEVLVELKVGNDSFRFAAARVTGKTFR